MPDGFDVDPLAHLPDPAKRYQVFAYTHEGDIHIEILDRVRKTAVELDLLSALRVAADINLEAARIIEVLGTQLVESLDDPLEHGTLPIWKRLIAEWGAHGERKADQN